MSGGGYDIGASLALSNASSASNSSAFQVSGGGAASKQTWLLLGVILAAGALAFWLFRRK